MIRAGPCSTGDSETGLAFFSVASAEKGLTETYTVRLIGGIAVLCQYETRAIGPL